MIAAALLAAGTAEAEGWFFLATVPECQAVESLVLWGLIDGGMDGDTTEFTEFVRTGEPAACLQALEGYGYPGLSDPLCLEAFQLLSTNGLPEWLAGEEPTYMIEVLAPPAPDACANMVVDLTAGQ